MCGWGKGGWGLGKGGWRLGKSGSMVGVCVGIEGSGDGGMN